MTANGGFEVAFHGEYQEIIPGERIVTTDVFEGMPDAAGVTTATFAEHGGHTTLTILMQHPIKMHRDAVISSGMEAGLQESLQHLEQVVLSLA